MIKNLISSVTGVSKEANNFIETSEERQKTLDGRHVRDMTSDNWFSKSVRPIVTIWTGLIWGVTTLVMLLKFYKEGFASEDWTTVTAFYGLVSTPFTTCIAWYFESRKREKMAAQNAKANIIIEKTKLKEEAKKERRLNREQRREERKQRKNET